MKLFILISSIIVSFFVNANTKIEQYSVAHFFKRADIKNIQISPDGKHLSAVIVREKQKVAAILDVSNPLKPKIIKTFAPPKHEFVSNAFWANNERLVFTTEKKQTGLTSPRGTGKLYAGNIDGSNRRLISGVGKNTNSTWITGILDRVDDDSDRIIVSSAKPGEKYARVDWLNVNTGKTNKIATSPFMSRTSFAIDHAHQVRFALSNVRDTTTQTIKYRDNNDVKWIKFKHSFKGNIKIAGFDKSNRYTYIISTDKTQFGLYEFDTQTKKFKQLLTDDISEIYQLMWNREKDELLAARFHVGKPNYKFINSEHPKVKLYKYLSQAFPESQIAITSMSKSKDIAGVLVSSDSNPGSLYLWDKETNRLIPLGPMLPQIDPKTMAKQKAFNFKSRDGVDLNGYMTYRPDLELKNRPMIVVVHGGPHGPYDRRGWNPESQLLANHGYLVLQVNYRGSGGFGEQFMKSGYRKWGHEMQNDVTDATQWAIDQGFADSQKVCIYGASYGGYATLAGITKEPDLYQCAFAFVGVYDLELMFKSGDIHRRKSGLYFLEEALGTDSSDLKDRSPITHVDKIKTPLYVAHGKKDDRADIKHYHKLIKALDKAEIKYKTLLTDREGHGFYDLKNNEKLYGEMLKFFKKHIGK